MGYVTFASDNIKSVPTFHSLLSLPHDSSKATMLTTHGTRLARIFHREQAKSVILDRLSLGPV